MSKDGFVLEQERIEPPSSDQLCVDGIVRGTIKANKDRRKKLEPEMLLWAAVIRKAFEDLGDVNHRDEARRWLLSNEFSPWSLLWICEQLNLNVAEVRKLAGVSPRPPAISTNWKRIDQRRTQTRDAAGFDIGGCQLKSA